jgi:Regulator of ribonuclease activity B
MSSIDSFWKAFERLRPELEESPAKEAMDQLLDALRLIDGRLYYHIAASDSSNHKALVISAEGHADLMPALGQLHQSAPQYKGWNMYVAYEGLVVFGQRNEEVIPLTENGDVLYEMAKSGDKLWIERPIDYSFVFPGEKEATGFSERVAVQGLRGEVSKYKGAKGYSFQVEIRIPLVPSHEAITSYEQRLGDLAAEFNGRADGWGCFNVFPS